MEIKTANINYGTDEFDRPIAVVTFVIAHDVAEDFEIEVAVRSGGDASTDVKEARAILHDVGQKLVAATG